MRCIVIGDPVEHSLSPLIHSAAFKAVGLTEWVFEAERVSKATLERRLQDFKNEGVRGISVTLPLKELVLKKLERVDPLALRVGSVNSIVNERGELRGYNTDLTGVLEPLQRVCKSLRGLKVAVLGAGGAARAAVCGLTEAGAWVTIYNRDDSRGKALASEFGAESFALTGNLSLKDFDIVANFTPVGMWPESDVSIVGPSALSSGQVVFDSIYRPYTTKLISIAQGQGCQTIRGIEMFVSQAAQQFKLYTGLTPPLEQMRKAVFDELTL